VKNPKELQDLAKDEQQFKGLINVREDRLLELFDRVEAATESQRGTGAALAVAQGAYEEQRQALTGPRRTLRRSAPTIR
jgi:hypothetical protein